MNSFGRQIIYQFLLCAFLSGSNYIYSQTLAEISHELLYEKEIGIIFVGLSLNDLKEIEIQTSKDVRKVPGYESILYFQEFNSLRTKRKSRELMEALSEIMVRNGKVIIAENENEIIYKQKGQQLNFVKLLIPSDADEAIELIEFSQTLEVPTSYLLNPSFEDVPKRGVIGPNMKMNGTDKLDYDTSPCYSWDDLGSKIFLGESPYDVHSGYSNFWRCSTIPSDGITYIGLVARENGATESMGTKLLKTLNENSCYNLTIDVCSSDTFESMTRRPDIIIPENFSNPIILRVKLRNEKLDETYTVYESDPIDNPEWGTLSFSFEALNDSNYLILECDHSNAVDGEFYNGNLLIDNVTFLEGECK